MVTYLKSWLTEWSKPTVLITLAMMVGGGILWGNNLTQQGFIAATERGENRARTTTLMDWRFEKAADDAKLHAQMVSALESIVARLDRAEARQDRLENRIYNEANGGNE